MALGARTGDVLQIVLKQGLKSVAIGLGLGLVGALAVTRFLSSLLYKVEPTDPAMGAVSGAVEIVEFSDFECPFCKRVAPVLNQVVSKYPGQVKLAWKHFPLPSHPAARPSAEAAECANDQGRFWQYHDLLFRNQEQLTTKDLKQYAGDIGLDLTIFSRCFDAATHRDKVMSDMQEGRGYGVSATPTVFINGRMVMGAASLETYEQIVREEIMPGQPAAAPK